jgi:hypothetical protein
MLSSPVRFAILAGALVSLVERGSDVANAGDCNSQNGCVGYREGMRVFSTDPTVRGVVEYNEEFVDLSTKTFKGQVCSQGVVRIGQNTNRNVDRSATQDTGKKVGAAGGHPVQRCATGP